MKANEAPEKIWMNDDWVHQFDVKEFMGEDSVEYTRTDTFIEKAWDWIEENMLSSNLQDKSLLYYERFKKYLEK